MIRSIITAISENKRKRAFNISVDRSFMMFTRHFLFLLFILSFSVPASGEDLWESVNSANTDLDTEKVKAAVGTRDTNTNPLSQSEASEAAKELAGAREATDNGGMGKTAAVMMGAGMAKGLASMALDAEKAQKLNGAIDIAAGGFLIKASCPPWTPPNNWLGCIGGVSSILNGAMSLKKSEDSKKAAEGLGDGNNTTGGDGGGGFTGGACLVGSRLIPCPASGICPDGNPCADIVCPNGMTWNGSVCIPSNNNNICSDGSPCPASGVCPDGATCGGGGGLCSDGSSCPASGVCPDGATCGGGGGLCSDGSSCPASGVCPDGATCGGGGGLCSDGSSCPPNGICPDGNSCTSTTDTSNGVCSDGSSCPASGVCPDGNSCTPVCPNGMIWNGTACGSDSNGNVSCDEDPDQAKCDSTRIDDEDPCLGFLGRTCDEVTTEACVELSPRCRIGTPDGIPVFYDSDGNPLEPGSLDDLGAQLGMLPEEIEQAKTDIANAQKKARGQLGGSSGSSKGKFKKLGSLSPAGGDDSALSDSSLESFKPSLSSGGGGRSAASSRGKARGGRGSFSRQLQSLLDKNKGHRAAVKKHGYKPKKLGNQAIGTAHDNIFDMVSRGYKVRENSLNVVP